MLFRGQRVNANAPGGQFHLRHAPVDLRRNIMQHGTLDALGADDDMPSAEAIAAIEETHEEKAPVTVVIEPAVPATPAPEVPAAPAPKKGKK